METYFDIRTLSLINSVVAVSIFLCMLYVIIKRKAYPGFLEWTVGAFAASLGMILLGLRNIVNDFISVIIANLLIVSYFVFISRGLARFSDANQHDWFDAGSLLLLAGSFWIFTFHFPNVNIRIIILSLIITIICCRGCFIILKRMTPHP